MSSSTVDNLVEDEANHNIFLTVAFSIQRLRRLWINYYHDGALNEDMPPSSFTFVISSLMTLAEMKSQGDPKFPFDTHAHVVKLSVACFLVYGFCSTVQYIISATHLSPNSVFSMIARLGQMASLCILVGALASLFYI